MTNMQGTEIKTAVKNKANAGAKTKTKDEDFNIDEMAEKELKGVAHGIVKEEHAEMASNHIEGDLSVKATDMAVADSPPKEQAVATDVTETGSGLSEQDKILKHQQEIEKLATERSGALSTSDTKASSSEDVPEVPETSGSLSKVVGEVETDNIIDNQEKQQELLATQAQE